MQVFLQAITFNHDTDSDTCDAFNIRKNETEFVTRPEWQRGISTLPEHSLAAYAIQQIEKKAITIKARFTRDDLEITSVEIQAINVSPENGPPRSKELRREIVSTVLPSPPCRNDVLGWVPPQSIEFLEDGDTLTLKESMIAQAGVGVHVIHWQWQYRLHPQDSWKDIEETTHQIYTVLSRPDDPWGQTPYQPDNTRLPWTDVMDSACYWARGVHGYDDAAAHITYSIRQLEKVFYVIYDPSAFYSDDKHFDCSAFLKLIENGIGIGSRLNCTDCASAVTTFANVLGCSLWQSTMDGGSGIISFQTNPIRLFGRTCWQRVKFGIHEVAWKDDCSESDALFDATLELDGDDRPSRPPRKPLLPRNLLFGGKSNKDYVFRLVSPKDSGKVIPKPHTRKRRSIQSPTSKAQPAALPLHDSPFSDYGHHEWPIAPTPKMVSREAISAKFVAQETFLDWNILVGPTYTESSDGVLQVQLLLSAPPEKLIRLDIDVCSSPEQSREYLRHRLGLFVTRLEPSKRPGEIAFVEPEVGATLFLRANLVALARDAGSGSVDLSDFTRRLDELFLGLLA